MLLQLSLAKQRTLCWSTFRQFPLLNMSIFKGDMTRYESKFKHELVLNSLQPAINIITYLNDLYREKCFCYQARNKKRVFICFVFYILTLTQ